MTVQPSSILACALIEFLLPAAALANGPAFDEQVAPILASRCLECHSGAEPQGKLDLSRQQAALAGGESGKAIVAGHSGASLLWERIEADEMPPKHPLPAAERVVLKAWLDGGAKWGADPIDAFRYTTTTRGGYDWWSLQPVARPALPAVKNAAWPRNAIDWFVLAKLEANGLLPTPEADLLTLARRVSFDLVGLPPASEGERGREGEREKDAFEAIVERLLASQHYGERWARHWLDVAHFGESDGFEFDRMRPHAWRYRDWVIEALNRDLPFDEFARLQIAGDVLRPEDEEAAIATGFLVGGVHDSLLPRGEIMQKIMRQDELEDLVGLVSQTFLGLTVNCARCHDHKFDAVRQSDYYRLAAALGGVKRGNRNLSPVAAPAELVRHHATTNEALRGLENQAQASALAKRESTLAKTAAPPEPVARWEFGGDLRDSVGGLHGTSHGRSRVDKEVLILEGRDGYVATAPLERDLMAKTLEAWVKLGNLNQRGGAVIGVQTLDGKTFDAIVFGEKEPRRWIAGSDNFRRTQSLAGVSDETEAQQRFVHLAVVYQADGQVQMYRDGQSYGQAYKTDGPVTFAAGKSQVMFGLRHSPPAESKVLTGRLERARLYDRALTADEIAASHAAAGSAVSEAELVAQLDEAAKAERVRLQQRLQELGGQLDVYRNRQVFAVIPQAAPVTTMLRRGDVQQPGEPIAAAGIACMSSSAPEFGLAADAPDKERRVKLAEWIASERNPLFARTIANRVWQYHFGRGLVETPNDLGFSGGQPSHPDLLDWLAAELVAQNWSLKHLHRLIVTSATYRQASSSSEAAAAIDADNKLLWRYSPRRLEAESIRDAMLVAAGELNPQLGGSSFMDFRPYMYKSAQYYEPTDPKGADFHRRSIYRFWARGGRNPLLDTFDCPDPATAAPKRSSTTTPLQALALFNTSFTLRMADRFAERLLSEQLGENSAQIAAAFSATYGRAPTSGELAESQKFIGEHGLPAFCRVLFNTNGFLYVH